MSILPQTTYQNRDWLKREYITKERFAKEIAEECNVSVGAISRWATKFNLSKISTNHKFDYKNKAWLYNEYVILKKKKKEIADQQGVAENTIERWRIKFEITKLKA